MKRLLPAPLLSVSLFAFWLVLNRSTSPGHLLIAALVAFAFPPLFASLRPVPVRIRRPLTIARLIATVGIDVVKSNWQIGRACLRVRRPVPDGALIRIPLDVRDANALASLAMITTVIPGTVWSELAPDRSALLLHVFDLHDEVEFVAWYKARYERPLMEIFE